MTSRLLHGAFHRTQICSTVIKISINDIKASSISPFVLTFYFGLNNFGLFRRARSGFARMRGGNNFCRFSRVVAKKLPEMAGLLSKEIGKREVWIRRVKGEKNHWRCLLRTHLSEERKGLGRQRNLHEH